MKKLLSIILLVFTALGLGLARADSEWDVENQIAQRQALVSWVADNAHDRLDSERSALIVDTATYYAKEHQLDVKLVLAVMRTESGFRASAQGKGSKGLMQVQVNWHRDKLRGRNPLNPKVSIEVGTRILSDCWQKHSGNSLKTLNCYSGGGGHKYYAKVESFRRTLSHYTETRVFDQFVARLAALQ